MVEEKEKWFIRLQSSLQSKIESSADPEVQGLCSLRMEMSKISFS